MSGIFYSEGERLTKCQVKRKAVKPITRNNLFRNLCNSKMRIGYDYEN